MTGTSRGNCITYILIQIASSIKTRRVAADVSRRYFLLRFSAETHEIVEVQQIRPRPNILARLAELRDVLREKPKRLSVAVRPAPIHVIAPLFDFPRLSFLFR